MYIGIEISKVVVMYIDPGVGSIVLQVLIGVAVAIPVMVKVYWGRIKGLFRRSK